MSSLITSITRPRIGLLLRRELRNERWINFTVEYHLQLLMEAGGVPLLIPIVPATKTVFQYYRDSFDGLMMVEGLDIDPQYYNSSPESQHLLQDTSPLKDSIETRLCRHALREKIPILGICRGSQLLNVTCGGRLYNDVQKETGSPITHQKGDKDPDFRHPVEVMKDTPLHTWYQERTMNVTSYHHQGVMELAPRFRPMARAPDGLVEAFYDPDPSAPFTVGLQFHPERMLGQYAGNRLVYRDFVLAARKRALENQLLDIQRSGKAGTDSRQRGKNEQIMALCYAAAEGDLERARQLSQHVDVNACDYDLRRPLHLAAAAGQLALVQFLTDKGADLNAEDRWGNTALVEAIKGKHDRVAGHLRGKGGKVNESLQHQLLWASAKGDLDQVKRLVENGVHPDKCDYDRRSPLHVAASEGRLNVVQFLVDLGANVNVADRWNETPLQDAKRQHHQNVVDYLLTKGASDHKGHEAKPEQLRVTLVCGEKKRLVSVPRAALADMKTFLTFAASESQCGPIASVALTSGAEVSTTDAIHSNDVLVLTPVA